MEGKRGLLDRNQCDSVKVRTMISGKWIVCIS